MSGRCAAALRASSRQTAGTLAIALTVAIWVVSVQFTRWLFVDVEAIAPLLFTYLNTALQAALLPVAAARTWWRRRKRAGRGGAGQWNRLEGQRVALGGAAEGPQPRQQSALRRGVKRLFGLWFASNYVYNLSLSLTTVSSLTILYQSSTFFVFGLSVLLLGEGVTRWKALASVLCVAGVAVVAAADAEDKDNVVGADLAGDFLAIAGACLYGSYQVLFKVAFPDDADRDADDNAEDDEAAEEAHVASEGGEGEFDGLLYFGFIGVLCAVTMWPLLVIWHYAGWEEFELPASGDVYGFVIANAVLSNIVANYLLAQGILLTSPLYANIGTALFVPLAVVSDVVVSGKGFSALYLVGTALVMTGFGVMVRQQE